MCAVDSVGPPGSARRSLARFALQPQAHAAVVVDRPVDERAVEGHPGGGIAALLPGQAIVATLLSAALWSAGFGIYLVRYLPVLTRTRLDGKPG